MNHEKKRSHGAISAGFGDRGTALSLSLCRKVQYGATSWRHILMAKKMSIG
jgi:hypothetical protein